MVVTWLLTVAGFILIVVEVGGWTGTGDNPHAITGIVTVVLTFIQPIGAYFRPHPGTNKRPIFNWAHWLLGNSAHILGIFHVIMHVVLSLLVCVSEGRISKGRVSSFPMKDMLGQPRHVSVTDTADAPFSGFKKHLLGIYAPIILLFVVAMICLVAFAPFGATFNP
ncbi:unnamed protein product [Leptidea sinapis]|uniref:Cytochrome b561 domain-containing protein n=1 Tax=Leptidea sinapis TaxID=189913 RepID=A0A5E4PPI4_9NEOP|nr:unnamed protein product [Leptidea sinapis]